MNAFLVSLVLLAADSGPADLAVIGPDAVTLNAPAELVVVGLPAAELDKSMGEQLAWMQQVRISVNAPKGVEQGQYSLKKSLSLSVDPLAWQFTLRFQASKPGDYVIAIDWNLDPYGLALHRVQVGGGGPGPNPPDPPIPPGTAVSALILLENDEVTPQQQMVLNQLRNDPISKRCQILDDDARTTEEQPLPLVVRAKAHIGSKPLPVVIALSAEGGLGSVAELPATSAELIALVKGWGIKP